MSNVIPNFVKFKLYRSSLYNSQFYQSSTKSLLDIEINFKNKCVKRLEQQVLSLSTSFYDSLSFIDGMYFKSLISRNLRSYITETKRIHEQKLLKLGLQQPKFVSPKDVIFNYSNYTLSKKEEFLLSLGLDFCLPNFKPSFSKFFLPFELFFNRLSHLPSHIDLETARQSIQSIAHKAFSSYKVNNWFPFLKKQDFDILKKLSSKKDLVICRPDKGKGVVLLNRTDYVSKMNEILSDETKFAYVGDPQFSIIFKIEDKVNRALKQFRDNDIINDQTYHSLYSSGSAFSSLYGLPKVHKPNAPLRPILAAYNSPNYSIAKFLVPLLSDISTNQYSLKNSSSFVPEILEQDSNTFMTSFDVKSLFTNVPLIETIDIILDKLFPTADSIVQGFNKSNFKKLLELSVIDTHFIFNGKIYKQKDGMAMGSPLGPTFANIFMCALEENFLNNCPDHFKPIFYKRYVDDTFLLFKEENHASLFLNYVNTFHENIKFSMEIENNSKLSFLDILISRSNGQYMTGIFRKDTFTGLGLNFFSHSPLSFKINSCKTLLSRAFSLCSNWQKFHEEVSFLRSYFLKNCYPAFIFDKQIRNFLNDMFRPKPLMSTVPKMKLYVSLPFMNHTLSVQRELNDVLGKLYPYVDFKFVFRNFLTIGSLFKFKDSLPELMRSSTVYLFSCPRCNLGTYVGCTNRMLKVRIDSHKGVSHRTGSTLSVKEHSAIRSHTISCKHHIQYKDFKILSLASDHHSLLFLESLLIKQHSPTLNSQTTSIPLHIA